MWLVCGSVFHFKDINRWTRKFNDTSVTSNGALRKSHPELQLLLIVCRRVAELVNIDRNAIDMYMVKPVPKELEAKHACFAAACAIADLIDHGDAYKVAEKWGIPQTTSFSGITAGQWQNLLTDVAKWAAMGVLVCQASGAGHEFVDCYIFLFCNEYSPADHRWFLDVHITDARLKLMPN